MYSVSDLPDRGDGRLVRALRGVGGALTAGLFVLTVLVAVVAYLASERHFFGPGREALVWHIAASVGAAIAQFNADRARGVVVLVWVLLIIAITGGLLLTQWWS